jgi:hypothetical protein
MDGNRFDVFVKGFAAGISRRAALRRGGAGVAAAALAGTALRAGAQDTSPAATPGATPPSSYPRADPPSTPGFLFVQTFTGGTFGPKEGEADRYVLTLSGAPDRTIYFSDRPERITGDIPTQQFLDRVGFTADAPNAALTVDGMTFVIELLGGTYDAAAGTLIYDVVFLTDYPGEDRPRISPKVGDPLGPDALAAQFGVASLFIDQADCLCCCNGPVYCKVFNGYNVVRDCGTFNDQPYCATGGFYECGPCRDHSDDCNAYFTDCCQGECREDSPSRQIASGC